MRTTYLIFCTIVILRTSLQLDYLGYHFKSAGLSLYNNNAGLNKIIKQLTQQYPQITKFRQCNEDKNIKYLQIGNKKQADGIIICNIHPRQLITAQICVNWAKRYVQKYRNWLDSYIKSNQQRLSSLSVNVFYNANLNREAVTQNDTCDRKSISGIDLNRNFPTEFNFYNSTTISNIYPGTSPISDPFTRCLQESVQQNKPIFFIDLHSGEDGGLFYQQGYNSRQDRLIFQQLNKQICNNMCRVTTLARDSQAINGHIFADLKVRYKMKYSLLLQVYGNDQKENCIQSYNPITSKDKDEVVRKWSDGIDVILREIVKRERQ